MTFRPVSSGLSLSFSMPIFATRSSPLSSPRLRIMRATRAASDWSAALMPRADSRMPRISARPRLA